jgi:chromosome segregation ATPase
MNIENPTDISAAMAALDEAKAETEQWRARVALHLQAVQDAEAALQAATEALKTKPSAATVTGKAIAEQILANAREAHEHECKTRNSSSKAEQIAQARVDYAQCLEAVSCYPDETSQDCQAIIEAEAAIRAAVGRLQLRATTVAGQMRTLEGAGALLGLPVPRIIIDDASCQKRITDALRSKYGVGVRSVHRFISLEGV